LSFLSPSLEHQLRSRYCDREIVTMSRVMDSVSNEARNLYLELVADIGLYKLPDGRTLRKTLVGQTRTSLWWYHPVTFRHSQDQRIHTNILSLLAIAQEATTREVGTLHLVKPPKGVAESLQSLFSVMVANSVSPTQWIDLGRRLFGRFKWMLRTIQTMSALKRNYERPQEKLDVVLQGFWDWSVFPTEGAENELSDLYFGNLPNELRKLGKTTGYWCKYDPANRPDRKKRSNKEVLAPLKERGDVVLLESLLNLSDVFRAALDFRPLLTFLQIHWRRSFEEVFMKDGLNFFPILRWSLIEGFISNALPQWSLLENSIERASKESEPQLLICFQEHFPPSRAMYAGLRGKDVRAWAIQHGCHSWSENVGSLHPTKEFGIQEDGQSVPTPDTVFSMGKHGEAFFLGCGYSEDQVKSIGSARYDHVRLNPQVEPKTNLQKSEHENINVLVVSTIPASVGFMLAETAVESVKGLDVKINLRLRQHPFDRMDKIDGYQNIHPWIEDSHETLDDDLGWADLVLINQSTVGAEAFIRGKAVWQIVLPSPERSALSEVIRIPCFCSVSELRRAFIDLAPFSEISKPNQAEIQNVYRSLFQTQKEKPSVAIAEAICKEFN